MQVENIDPYLFKDYIYFISTENIKVLFVKDFNNKAWVKTARASRIENILGERKPPFQTVLVCYN